MATIKGVLNLAKLEKALEEHFGDDANFVHHTKEEEKNEFVLFSLISQSFGKPRIVKCFKSKKGGSIYFEGFSIDEKNAILKLALRK